MSQQILKRLDRFYLSMDLLNIYPVAHIEVLASQTMSDLVPIRIVLQEMECPKKGPFRMQAKHLTREQI